MNRKCTKNEEFFKLGHELTWIFYDKILFPNRCTVQGIRESQIAQKSNRYWMLPVLYIRTENVPLNEESFKLGHELTWNFYDKILFPNRCTVQGIRESQIAQKSNRYWMLLVLYIWTENVPLNEESFKLGHELTWNFYDKILFPNRCTVQGIRESQIAQKSNRYWMLSVLYIWTENVPLNEESFKFGHAPTQNNFMKISCTLQGMKESHIVQKVKDTECFIPWPYEQKTYHKMRNLSSWSMHQLEIFHEKNVEDTECFMFGTYE